MSVTFDSGIMATLRVNTPEVSRIRSDVMTK